MVSSVLGSFREVAQRLDASLNDMISMRDMNHGKDVFTEFRDELCKIILIDASYGLLDHAATESSIKETLRCVKGSGVQATSKNIQNTATQVLTREYS